MLDYFDIYKFILLVIRDKKPANGKDLFNSLSEVSELQKMKQKYGNNDLTIDTLSTLDNLLDDGLVRGTKTLTKMGTWYNLNGLSTAGHQYLLSIEDPNFKEKLIAILKEEGIPLTPSNITKFVAKAIF